MRLRDILLLSLLAGIGALVRRFARG
jgi:hypothetical protein